MKIIIRILRTFKNILFPKIYMPWEQNDLDEITFAANKRTPRLYSLI